MTARSLIILGFVVAAGSGCTTATAIQSTVELAGQWQGRVSSPVGHAMAAMIIAPDGKFKGTMFFTGDDRAFGGALVVVRPGQVRYQGTEGNGTVRVLEEDGRRVLKFFRDGGGIDAVFHQL